jgi:hypothetical protein
MPKHMKLDVVFEQSFAYPLELTISKNEDSGYVTIRVEDYEKVPVGNKDSVRLSEEDFASFFKTLDTVSLLTLLFDTAARGTYTDGGSMATTVLQDGQRNYFEIDLPSRDKTPGHYRLLDAVFELANKKFPRFDKYIESNQRCYEYSPFVNIKSENPKIVRLYGVYQEWDSLDLAHFFQQFPDSATLVVDLTNVGYLGLNSLFRTFDKSHRNLMWVTGDRYDYFLPSIGIDSAKVVKTLEEAMKRTAENKVFMK